jgi:D-alanyl-D-alanine carboxypeptidase
VYFLRPLLRKPSLNWIVLVAALGIVAPRLAHAEAHLLIEADTGKVLEAENATYPWYPASVTKLMTAYVTLKAVKEGRITLDTLVTVSPVAASQSPSKMGFRPGTQVTVDNALKMMLVKSANDMAVVLAEGVGGSIDGFSALMNQNAQRLGMTQTSYVNPNGLPADGQITSARDLAILARAIIRDLPEYEYFVHIPSIRFGRRVTQNFNKLIGRYPGADGFKTGFICASGYNLVASATRNGKRLIAVVLGASSGQMRAVRAAQMLERGFANSESARRDVQRQAPQARQRRGRGHGRQQRRLDQRRRQHDLLRGRAAAADPEAVGIDGGRRRALRADRGLYRPDPDRRGIGRSRRRGFRQAGLAASRKEEPGCGEEARDRGRAERQIRQEARAEIGGQAGDDQARRRQGRRRPEDCGKARRG